MCSVLELRYVVVYVLSGLSTEVECNATRPTLFFVSPFLEGKILSKPTTQQVVFGTVSIALSNNKEQERRTFWEALVWSTVFWAMYLGNIPGARMMLLLRNEQSQ